MQIPSRIKNQADLDCALVKFRQLHPSLDPFVDALPEVPLRLRTPGFEGLADIVVAQMVSRASANAIFDRLKGSIIPFTPERFLQVDEQVLVVAGLSRAKQSTLLGLAQAIENGFDLQALCHLDKDDAIKRLTALKGIGPWTAEVFLLFCAGHTDIFPAGDIALQHAQADILSLTERPDAKQAAENAAQWAPLRSVAARILYAHYALMKKRSAIPV